MGIPSPGNVLTKQQRIAEIARQAPRMAFTSLSHHIDINWLYEAYPRTRKDGAPGAKGRRNTRSSAEKRVYRLVLLIMK